MFRCHVPGWIGVNIFLLFATTPIRPLHWQTYVRSFATIDSVDEGVMDFPAKSVVMKGSELTLDVEAVRSSRNTQLQRSHH